MVNEVENIKANTFAELINKLGLISPIVGEKTLHTKLGFKVRDPKKKIEYQLSYWDILRLADESYWSPLDGDRKTIYNVSSFEILINKKWVKISDWYIKDNIEEKNDR